MFTGSKQISCLLLAVLLSSTLFFHSQAMGCAKMLLTYLANKHMSIGQNAEGVSHGQTACALACSVNLLQMALLAKDREPLTNLVGVMNESIANILETDQQFHLRGLDFSQMEGLFDDLMDLYGQGLDARINMASLYPYEFGEADTAISTDLLAHLANGQTLNAGIIGVEITYGKTDTNHAMAVLDAKSEDGNYVLTVQDPEVPGEVFTFRSRPVTHEINFNRVETFELLPVGEITGIPKSARYILTGLMAIRFSGLQSR